MTQARWQQLTEWPLAIVAAIFLATYAWQLQDLLEKKSA